MFLHLKKAFYQRIMIFHFGRVQSCCTAREESFIKKGKKSVGEGQNHFQLKITTYNALGLQTVQWHSSLPGAGPQSRPDPASALVQIQPVIQETCLLGGCGNRCL